MSIFNEVTNEKNISKNIPNAYARFISVHLQENLDVRNAIVRKYQHHVAIEQ